MPLKTRVAFFFDGFNIYHSLQDDLKHPEENPLRYRFRQYKWLDYYKLAEAFTLSTEEIVSVRYFTAYQVWNQHAFLRHQTYVEALKTQNVVPVFGKYKKKSRWCKSCGCIRHDYHEEKQTDVNIALSVVLGAYRDEYDTAVIGTADSDLIPALKEVKKIPKHKRVVILFPINRKSVDLTNEAHFIRHIKIKHIKSCQLPDKISIGGIELSKPLEWIEPLCTQLALTAYQQRLVSYSQSKPAPE